MQELDGSGNERTVRRYHALTWGGKLGEDGTLTEMCPNLWWVMKSVIWRLHHGWGLPDAWQIAHEIESSNDQS